MMNLYNAGSGKVRKISDEYDAAPALENIARAEATSAPGENEERRNDPMRERRAGLSRFVDAKRISDRINSLLPGGMNMEDLLIFIILLLIYLEKEDEEILIILSVLLLGDLNIFRGKTA